MALDANTYSRLALPGSNAKMQTYGSVDPTLFERILQQTTQLAPAPRKGGLDAR
jgi:hypothetical protein